MTLRARLVVDGGTTYGYGHLSRGSELRSAFKAAGFSVDYVNLSESPGENSLASPPCDLTLIDLPYDGDRWLADARSKDEAVIGLDYIGQGRPDIIIRMNSPPGNVSADRVLCGLDYAIIRRDIRTAPRSQGNYVLVSIGGADIREQGVVCAEKLRTFGLEPILVLG